MTDNPGDSAGRRAAPMRGDIRLTKDYPPGTPLHLITEYEVWDGERWISSSNDMIYQVQDPT